MGDTKNKELQIKTFETLKGRNPPGVTEFLDKKQSYSHILRMQLREQGKFVHGIGGFYLVSEIECNPAHTVRIFVQRANTRWAKEAKDLKPHIMK